MRAGVSAGAQELEEQLESGAPLLTLESQTPVREFDVFAFSVSFEWDYTNVVSMLRLAGMPPRAADAAATIRWWSSAGP